MRHSSIRLMLLMLVLILSGSFSKISPPLAPKIPAGQSGYYWYDYPSGAYNDYNSVGDEEWEWWVYWDEPVNTDPTGGTLIEQGFINNTNPHEFPPSVLLYLHPN